MRAPEGPPVALRHRGRVLGAPPLGQSRAHERRHQGALFRCPRVVLDVVKTLMRAPEGTTVT